MTNYDELRAYMASMLQSNPDMAKSIGKNAVDITEQVMMEDNLFHENQSNQYSLMFCIGASWALASLNSNCHEKN